MASNSVEAKYEVARSIGSITASFVAVGTPLSHPSRILRYVNATSSLVLVSVDGVNTHDVILPNSDSTLSVGTNRGNPSPEFVFPKGTQFYVSGTPGTGTFAIVSVYAFDPRES